MNKHNVISLDLAKRVVQISKVRSEDKIIF